MYKATDEGFDLRKIVPAPTNTPVDGGPYITMGLAYGTSPDGTQSDVTIHRFSCVDKDKLAMWITPGSRHRVRSLTSTASAARICPSPSPSAWDPAVYMCCGFEAPTTPLGFNELQIAGAPARPRLSSFADCVTVPQKCIANAEYVLEGYLMHDETINEGCQRPRLRHARVPPATPVAPRSAR